MTLGVGILAVIFVSVCLNFILRAVLPDGLYMIWSYLLYKTAFFLKVFEHDEFLPLHFIKEQVNDLIISHFLNNLSIFYRIIRIDNTLTVLPNFYRHLEISGDTSSNTGFEKSNGIKIGDLR